MNSAEMCTAPPPQPDTLTKLSRIRFYMIIAAMFWSSLIALSLVRNHFADRRYIHDVALAEARMALEKDLLYRRWAAGHGGVRTSMTGKYPADDQSRDIVDCRG